MKMLIVTICPKAKPFKVLYYNTPLRLFFFLVCIKYIAIMWHIIIAVRKRERWLMGWLANNTKEDKRIRVFIHLPTVTNNFHIPGFVCNVLRYI